MADNADAAHVTMEHLKRVADSGLSHLTVWKAAATAVAEHRRFIESNKRRMQAIRHGYVSQGLDGSNEKQRDASLAMFLAEDPEYGQILEATEQAEWDAALNDIEATYNRALAQVDTALLHALGGIND